MMSEHFTKVKAMVFPRQVLAGHGVIRRTGEVFDGLGIGRRAMLVTGERTASIAGKKVRSLLEKYSVQVSIELTGAATQENLEALVETARKESPDAVLGVGGGSKIDLAKMTARLCGAEFISVPTSASHDGISSPRASIKRKGVNLSLEGVTPVAIIADTQIISRAPYRTLASGCADVMSNSTALKDWEIAVRAGKEQMSTTAYALSSYASASIIRDASRIRKNIETSTWLAVRPIIASGLAMGVAGSSRPASGSEHLFSHALDAMGAGSGMHGEQCGVGAIMMSAHQGVDWRPLRAALKKVGCPVDAKGLGITAKEVVDALLKARSMRKDRFTILDSRPLNRKSATALAEKTLVI